MISLLPAKRGRSPPSGRPSKIPKLGLKQELVEEMQRSNDTLRSSVELLGEQWRRATVTEVTSILPQLKADIVASLEAFVARQSQEDSEKATAELLQQSKDVATDTKAELEKLRAELQSLRAAAKKSNMDAKQSSERAMEQALQFQKEMRSLVSADDLRGSIREINSSLASQEGALRQIGEVKTLLETPPRRPGDDGYLAQLTPSGWDQKAYEALLLRASWFYMYSLGMPDGGVTWDPLMLESTRDTFSDIVEYDHLLKAIEHAHVQAYRCPLRQNDEAAGGFPIRNQSLILS